MSDRTYQLANLKSTLADSTSGYALFRKSYTQFLLTVATDSNLLVEQSSDSLGVSFPRLMSVKWSGFAWFAVCDMVLALLLGTAPIAEYGYSGAYDFGRHEYEWTYGIPAAMLQVIARFNSWRAGSRVALDN
ncbi:Fungal Zn(2)-Cys(6) binuclear cluster domain [Rhizoctonia solani]|uniref:Fungal Zn(2)-Cys(6) binuclear cluster domain n=1 Tax=Rhizoctonia solani TaxID=456999 RepID=A0A8H8SVG6_9AGAM|nr:Fungal Zn(2)-Cys(6) binuclear cluster domain [Rhizoctonia solani]QRW19946.1 Fungal Zn(2)-Cys(6) binuclear cluster domain [Rhizoctonia solani]